MSGERWFSETLTPGVRLSLEAARILHREQTASHDLALIENEIFGKVLLLDGAVQVTTRDEFIYHEMMAHVPILGHGDAKRVLIVGGGDCGLAEEVLKHGGVESLTQVEIDPTVVELAKAHFAEINAPVFEDPRFRLVIDDGAAFVARTEERFDVVLVDSTDPVGPGAVLFTADFYKAVKARLASGGVLVTQNGVPFLQREEFSFALANLAATFRHVSGCAIAVPTYFGGHMVLGWGSDDLPAEAPANEALAERFAAAALQTRYYTPALHKAAFTLPRYIEDALPRPA